MHRPLRTRQHGALDAATLSWLALLGLTLASVLASSQGGSAGTRLAMGLVVAALCGLKAELLIRHYLHVKAAGPVFTALVRIFAVLAPLALAFSALREGWPA
jgi:hypothetical protein